MKARYSQWCGVAAIIGTLQLDKDFNAPYTTVAYFNLAQIGTWVDCPRYLTRTVTYQPHRDVSLNYSQKHFSFKH